MFLVQQVKNKLFFVINTGLLKPCLSLNRVGRSCCNTHCIKKFKYLNFSTNFRSIALPFYLNMHNVTRSLKSEHRFACCQDNRFCEMGISNIYRRVHNHKTQAENKSIKHLVSLRNIGTISNVWFAHYILHTEFLSGDLHSHLWWNAIHSYVFSTYKSKYMQPGADKTNRTKPKECQMVIVMSCACWVEIGHFLSHFLSRCTLRAKAVWRIEDRDIQTENTWWAQEVTFASA